MTMMTQSNSTIVVNTNGSMADVASAPMLSGTLAPHFLLKQRYNILEEVGRGGFGAVYKAQDTHLNNRLVAVKEMVSQGGALHSQELQDAIESFKREAVMLAGLTHPNLPRIYEQFGEQGRLYLVMDFIEGETLEARLQKMGIGLFPLESVLDLVLQLCSVLEYLHARNPPIIFRDLKPGNIMLTPSGHLFLIDFGIARIFKPGQEKDTTALGSYGYAPPEQYGKSQTTVRADVYSLGATLHQLLSGDDPSETPFQFAPLRIPDRVLAGLVMRMVNVEVEKRPASIAIVRQELQRITAQFTMGGTLPRLAIHSLNTSAPMAASNGKAMLPGMPAKADMQYYVPGPLIQNAPTSTQKKRQTKTTSPSQSLIPPQKNTLYICKGHNGRITSVVWSPDGKYLASASYDKTIQLWDASNGKHIRVYRGHTARVNAIAWSPDGKTLASASSDGTVHLINPLTGTVDFIFHKHDGAVNALAWSPDGKSIASAGSDRTVLIWDVRTREISSTYSEHADDVLAVVWSPNGQSIASAGKDRNVRIWEPEKWQQKRSFLGSLFFPNQGQKVWVGHTGQINALAWSRDGQYLASACNDHWVRIRDISSFHTTYTLNIDQTTIKNTLAWSPKGQYLALGGNDKVVRIWNADRKQETSVYYGHMGYVVSVVWSPDGSKIASAGVDRTLQVWQVE
jgi:WD40 repeat protein